MECWSDGARGFKPNTPPLHYSNFLFSNTGVTERKTMAVKPSLLTESLSSTFLNFHVELARFFAGVV